MKKGEQIYLSISTARHSTDIHIMFCNIQNERKGYSKKREIERISQGRLELSCEWPSMPGQTLRLHFLSNREPKAFHQQGGDMTDFMEKDGLKETESKGNGLSKEVTARSREKMGKSQPKAKNESRRWNRHG